MFWCYTEKKSKIICKTNSKTIIKICFSQKDVSVAHALVKKEDYFKAQEEYRNLPNGMAYKYRQQDCQNTKICKRRLALKILKKHAIKERMSRPSIMFSGQQVGTPIILNTKEIDYSYKNLV